MDKTRFKELREDNSVIKFEVIGTHFLHVKKNNKVINFSFIYNGAMDSLEIYPEKRIFLNIFPFEKLISGIDTHLYIDDVVILVNSDIYEYAMTFKISVDIN